mmetsp:Transcript_34253/g.55551  ORF Transcript_34253/g.55551 Transcript_34253/m.55551 type:complete len:112 (+) Transcript_34253:235-570(+)
MTTSMHRYKINSKIDINLPTSSHKGNPSFQRFLFPIDPIRKFAINVKQVVICDFKKLLFAVNFILGISSKRGLEPSTDKLTVFCTQSNHQQFGSCLRLCLSLRLTYYLLGG